MGGRGIFSLYVEVEAGEPLAQYWVGLDIDGDGIHSYFTTFATTAEELNGVYYLSWEGILEAPTDSYVETENVPDDGSYTASVRFRYQLIGDPEIHVQTLVSDLPVPVENAAPLINTCWGSGSVFKPHNIVDFIIDARDPGGIDTVQWITVHWGDGESDTITNTNIANLTHIYESTGEYAIQVVASDGEDESYKTIFVDIKTIYPHINAATATVLPDNYVALSLPSGYSYEWSGNTISQVSGNTVRLYPIGQHRVTVKVTDSAGRIRHAAFVFQVPEGTPPGGSFQVSPFVGGKVDVAGAADPDVEPIVTYFRMMYGEKGMTLLRAFRRAGGEVVVEDLFDWWVDGWLSDIDWEVGGTGQTIQLEESLDPVTAAQHLMSRLWQASGTYEVRVELAQLNNIDPTDEDAWQALRNSYQAAIQNGAGIAAQLSELYISGVTIVSEPLDIIVCLSEAVDGNYKSAAIGAIPLISSVWIKQGGKIIFKAPDGRIIGRFTPEMLPFLKKVAKYEDLVMSNKWESWDAQIPNTPEWQKRRIRRFARKHRLIPYIPITRTTKYANFNSVAYEIPGATHAGHMVQLPHEFWERGVGAQETFLNNTYFNGVQPEGYTWHHHQEDGLMQLVPSGVHRAYKHNGGRAPGHWAHRSQ